jgi:hypothetical protein
MTIASNIFITPPAADAMDATLSSSSTILSEKVVREGLYKDYEVDLVQETDDARSTFKAAKETKSKKGTFIFLGDLNDKKALSSHSKTHNTKKTQASTRLSCLFLWLDPSSFPWPSISGMCVMMILRTSSLPRIFQSHPRRRDGSKI